MEHIPARPGSVAATGLVVTALVLSACTGGAGPAEAITLAKVDGWDPALDEPLVGEGADHAVLEIAYDEAAARRLWDAAVPASLPERGGTPDEPGVYRSLDDLDPAEEVVALWSSGESGSCSQWVDAVNLEGELVVVTTTTGGGLRDCTSDYVAYRSVLALDRDDVPEPGERFTSSARARAAPKSCSRRCSPCRAAPDDTATIEAPRSMSLSAFTGSAASRAFARRASAAWR